MGTKIIITITMLFFPVTVFCQTYITSVTVVDVEKQQLLPGRVVTMENNKITGVYDAKLVRLKMPAGATVIDGTGKYLMPGMTDAHVHFFQSGGLYTRPDAMDLRKYMPYDKEIEWVHDNMEDQLRRYTRLGITTVIDVGSTISFLNQRDSFQNKNYAPAIFMTGPLITSYEPAAFKDLKNDEPFYLVKNADEAKAALQKQLPYHPDFIKIWYIAGRGQHVEDSARKFFPAVKATIDEAHQHNMKVAVHATERITAQLAIEAGCDYLVHSVDDEILNADFINLMKKNHVIICPTLIVADNYASTYVQGNSYDFQTLINANPIQLGSLNNLSDIPDKNMIANYKMAGQRSKAIFAKKDSVMLVNLKKLADAGIIIASGTDAGNIGTLHATSYMDELRTMKKAGLSNWQIMQASTINGAKVLGKENNFGSITIGKTADMVLLDADPIADIDNLQKIDLVINKGYVIKPDTLIKETAINLVQQQLNAYNAHNLDAFLVPYDDDVELYDFPNTLMSKGKEAMKKSYSFMLSKLPGLHCELTGRIINGNTIIDHEKVTGIGNKPIEAVAIYHIENNKIKKVYFIR